MRLTVDQAVGCPFAAVAHAVRLSLRRLGGDRGIVISYETVRRWAKKFGPDCADRVRREPPDANQVRHWDELVVTTGGTKHWL